MAKLSKENAMLLKKLVKLDEWDALVLAYGAFVDKLNTDEVAGQTAFDTLKALHIKQGKVDGLREFFERVERLNFE